jgi:hypothetical protein
MTRDNIVWGTVLAGSILTYLAGHASYVPEAYHEMLKDGAAIAGILAAALMASPLRHSGNLADPGFDWKKLFGR